MSIVSGFKKVKNYIKETDGYKLLSRWTSSDTVDVNGKTLTETITGINTSISGKANSLHTHGNGDITSLDASKITSGTIDIDRLPQGALDRLIKVADDTARFKLTTKDVQLGDSVKVTSTKKMYIVIDETKLSSEAGYEPYTADSATSVPWSGVTGKPSTYTPSSHTHTKSQITDFPTSMPASDVPAWAKASSKPSYTKSEVGLGNVDNTADSAKSVKYATSAGSAPANGGNASTVNGHTVNSNVPANAKFTDTNTWTALKGATTSAAGTAGYAPAPAAGAANRYLRSDGTWSVPPDTNTTYSLAGLMGGSAKGSKTQPVYWTGSAWANTSYTLGKSVPSNAVFTDTNTWRGIQNNLTSTSTTDSLSAAQGKALNDKIAALNSNLNYTALYSGSTTDNVVIPKSKFAGYQFYVIEYAYGNSGSIFDILTLYTPSNWTGTATRMLRLTHIAAAQYIQNLYEVYSIVGDSSNITIKRGNMYYNTLYSGSIGGNVSGQPTGIQILHVFGVGHIG